MIDCTLPAVTACGPGMVAVRPRLTGEVPTVPSETVLFARTALPLRVS